MCIRDSSYAERISRLHSLAVEESCPIPAAPLVTKAASLDDALKQIDESFSAMLLRKIDECGMTDAELSLIHISSIQSAQLLNRQVFVKNRIKTMNESKMCIRDSQNPASYCSQCDGRHYHRESVRIRMPHPYLPSHSQGGRQTPGTLSLIHI